MTTFMRSAALAGAAAAITVGLVGCTSGSAAPEAADDGQGLQIVTTTTQLTDFTVNVTEGTGAEVTGLLQPNASAHSFEANAADIELIRAADVVVMNGLGLEPWLETTLTSAGFEGLLIDASAGVSDEDLAAGNAVDVHAEDEHADETHAEDEHAEETHAEDETHAADEHVDDSHDGHDHSGDNPHIWTSPLMAGDMTTEIAEDLAALDAPNADTYRENASEYVAKLDELDAWIKENVDTIPEAERLLVSNHDSLTYFNQEYGITFVGSVMPSWDDNAEPSAAEIDALVEAIRDTGVEAVFTETQLSPGTAEAIAEEAGVKIYSGDEALYTDSLGDVGSTGETYIGSTIHNTTQLVDSWGGAVTQPPVER